MSAFILASKAVTSVTHEPDITTITKTCKARLIARWSIDEGSKLCCQWNVEY